jgi:hypothetical protein
MSKKMEQVVPEIRKADSLNRRFLAAVTAIEVIERMPAILTWIHQYSENKLFGCFLGGLR